MSILDTIPFIKVKPKAPRQLISEDWTEHSQVLQSDVNMFCWQRPLDLKITHYLKNFLPSDLSAIRSSIDKENLHAQIKEARSLWDNDENSEGDLFWQDVENIVADFLEFSDHGTGVLHLRMVTNNACTKFHTDGYRLRLFSTYHGPGTEWLPEDAINRDALGTNNECIIVDPDKIRQMRAGHVAIFKGERPGRRNSVRGIVHRSPTIANTLEKRIILRVDI
ncbi:MAG: DUF1826 domain-containing protein [Bacteroidota bacterium]